MAFRFGKSIKLAPGIRLNKGGSVTVGGRGISTNYGNRGVHSNVGIPGTGLHYRSKITESSSQRKVVSEDSIIEDSNSTQIAVSLVLQDDGSVTFQDKQGNSLSDEYVSQAKLQKRNLIENWLQENCDEINEEIISIVNIYLTTSSPDTEILFTPRVFNEQLPIPPQKDFIKPQPHKPILKQYTFLAKKLDLFRKNIDEANANIQANFDYSLEKWETEKLDFEANYIIEHENYLKQLEQYKFAESDFQLAQKERRKFVEEDRLNEIAAMQMFLEESLQTIVWPRETLISYDIINEGKEVHLDVDLPEIEDMPNQRAKVNKKELRLILKDISNTENRKTTLLIFIQLDSELSVKFLYLYPQCQRLFFLAIHKDRAKPLGKLTMNICIVFGYTEINGKV